ncbi:MAG: DUF6364 family protein [candidate division KSB1 bacterium]|nr:DUF6364 family protein [candidate division KSB1 bacterium]
MNKKLILYIDEPLITFAHRTSQQTRQSISHLVENHLQRLRDDIHPEKLSEETQALHGILQGHTLDTDTRL